MEYFVERERERERESLENMSWVKLFIEVNVSLSSNAVFGYQESFKKIEKVTQTIFS